MSTPTGSVPAVCTSSTQVSLETSNDVVRRETPNCTAYVQSSAPDSAFPSSQVRIAVTPHQTSDEESGSSLRAVVRAGLKISVTPHHRAFDEARVALKLDALRYVRRQDMLAPPPETEPDCIQRLSEAVSSCLGLKEEDVHLADVFDPQGKDAACITSKSVLRAHGDERSAWADQLIRAHTIHHNGAQTNDPSLDELPGQIKKIGVDSRTRFQKAARKYKPPTEASVRSKMPEQGRSDSTHPFLAAARYATVSSLRDVASGLGALQIDPCISSNPRDKSAYGDRPLNTCKDFGHVPRPFDYCSSVPQKTVHTLIDCLAYETKLAKYSGDDMIIWTSYYPKLAGETCESVYFADSEKTFVEIIGKNKATGYYEQQTAWDFTASDVVYIENEERSSFTIYNVIRHFQPELLKQVVFLCALQTVNLPYEIVNDLVRWTKKHDLASVGITTPGPCANVVLVPKDPARPFTQDILVMANGSPGEPTVSIKYMKETSPRSCATMTTEVYNYLKYLNAGAGRGLTVHEAIKRLETYAHEEEDVCVPGSAAYCELLRTVAWWGDLPNVVYYGKHSPVEDAPTEAPTAKAVMAGPKLTLNKPGVLAKTPEAMEAYVDEKMLGFANTTEPTSEWTKISDMMLTSWIKNVVHEAGTAKGSVELVDREKVLENRTKAVQLAREVTDGLGPEGAEIGRVDNKVEGAHKIGACPRGTASPAYDVSIMSGALGKTLEKVFMNVSWYNPHMNPQELSEAVAEAYNASCHHEKTTDSGGVRSVDYTGADEKHCKHSNRILRRLIDYVMTTGDREQALWLYDACFHMPLQAGPKVRSSKWKNASGTGITTVLNTGVFAQREHETTVVAMVFRSMEDTGELTPGEYIVSDSGKLNPSWPTLTHRTFLKHLRTIQETWDLHKVAQRQSASGQRWRKGAHVLDLAYTWIGPKFGDDGLAPGTPYVSDATWKRAMLYVDKMDGFLRKLDTTSALLEQPVEYLSRIYPCPLRSPSSYCKVEKAVDKLSVAVNRDKDRYALKIKGYHSVDGSTPIVGALCTAIAAMYGFDLTFNKTEEELAKILETDRDLYYKIVGGPHPSDENTGDEFYASVAADYGMTSGELREFDNVLRTKSTWSGIQGMMLPTKLISETLEDPLGLKEAVDPPGVGRVEPYSSTTRGEDVRMMNFEAERAKVDALEDLMASMLGLVGKRPLDIDRTKAAIDALRFDTEVSQEGNDGE